MQDINSDQDDILKLLGSVEGELDMLLSQELSEAPTENASVLDFYRDPISLSSKGGDFYEKRVSRQQVFEKAYTIEQYSQEIA